MRERMQIPTYEADREKGGHGSPRELLIVVEGSRVEDFLDGAVQFPETPDTRISAFLRDECDFKDPDGILVDLEFCHSPTILVYDATSFEGDDLVGYTHTGQTRRDGLLEQLQYDTGE